MSNTNEAMAQAATLPFDAQGQAFCAQVCRHLFLEVGIANSLTFLFSYLHEHIPLTRIFCGFRRFREGMFTPVADTLPSAHNKVCTLPTTAWTQDQIDLMLGTDELTPYILEEAFCLSGGANQLRTEDLASYLRLPLFELGESRFQMLFCSSVPGTFSEELTKIIIIITQPLGQALRQSFMETGHVREEKHRTLDSSALDRLRRCPGLQTLRQEVEQAASTDCTVLILGETGTGKEVLADAIHEASARSGRPFIKINCGAISDALIDSEFFGHEKGAFTGAASVRAGYFEAASGGTILLDEIGDLPLPVQARLLRVLDRREILRVGSSRSIPLDIRFIASTHKDLRRMVVEGTFREDLWYRLNVLVLESPPLRTHRIDIPVLARLFVNIKARSLGVVPPPHINQDQMENLCHHNWPGNIRELEHVIERALVRCKGKGATALELHKYIGSHPIFVAKEPETQQERTIHPEATQTGQTNPSSSASNNRQKGTNSAHWLTLTELTDSYIDEVLNHTKGQIGGDKGAAKILGVHPNTLRLRKNKKSEGDHIIC